MKTVILAALGAIGGFIAAAFGGWNPLMTTLGIFMAIDFFTGLIVALVFHKSPKTETGGAESKAGWKGLCRKGTTFLVVIIAARLDAIIGTTVIRDGTIIAYILNETLSIIENAGLMGVPIPTAISEGIELLKNKDKEKADDVND